MHRFNFPEVNSADQIFEDWYELKGWKPFDFQREMLECICDSLSGLLNAPTGSGKTYAVWIPLMARWMQNNAAGMDRNPRGLKVLWITPLRALAGDIRDALQESCDAFSLDWSIQTRTGDTPANVRQQQIKQMPQCLITTPESLHILLARKNNRQLFSDLEAVVVDEWHELMGNKRGVQVELGLSRLRGMLPQLLVWGISATIGNLIQATEVLLGTETDSEKVAMVRANLPGEPEMVTVMPPSLDGLSWGGHLGIRLLDQVAEIIKRHNSCLVFTNTRSQAEIWYHKLLDASPDLAGVMAMHHGSLDRDLRGWVEDALHLGKLKAVVCTSSLDLGVDFRPVDAVIQIGGPKGVARFMQRAGRSGHRPGEKSLIYFVPTNALELIEAAALREAIRQSYVEKRRPVIRPFDVLVQYLVTLAVGGSFDPKIIFGEVRNTFAFQEITSEEWAWALDFISRGGESLQQYDEYRKVEMENGMYKVVDRRTASRHRLHIGTIVSEPLMRVRFVRGGHLGTIEEYFIASLKQGDTFWFAGQNLEFVMAKEMTAMVRPSGKKTGRVPQWMGGRQALTSYMSRLLRSKINEIHAGECTDQEVGLLSDLLALQASRSAIPAEDELLIELFETDEGHHMLVYPFEGRLVHEAMAGLLAYRLGQYKPMTWSVAMNDYGFELMSDASIPLKQGLEDGLFSSQNLHADLSATMNWTEMALRRFREIALIAGLSFQGFPGKYKKSRHLQSSTQLLFKVFSEYDPKNLLLMQAYDEVLEYQFEEARMRRALMRIGDQKIRLIQAERPGPFAFPIMVERFRERMSNEKVEDRIKKLSLDYDGIE